MAKKGARKAAARQNGYSGPVTRSKSSALNGFHQSEQEFPILDRLGLYAANIKGDGNCLFRSLSDQYYGDGGDRHAEVRKEIVSYMREHASFFALFVEGAGYGETFDDYTNRMSKDGVYGDNAEIVAFSRRYNVNVVIYQNDFMYIVANENGEPDAREAHIAYHTWEHYSSVRNQNGPHSGLPKVEPVAQPGMDQPAKPSSAALAPMWKVDVVRRSVTYPVPDERIVDLLTQHNGDIESVVEHLITADEVIEGEVKTNSASEIASEGVVGSQTETGTTDTTNQQETKDTRDNVHTKSSEGRHQQSGSRRQPRRQTARERKERQKREAMERKKRARASDGTESARNTPVASLSKVQDGGLRTMYI